MNIILLSGRFIPLLDDYCVKVIDISQASSYSSTPSKREANCFLDALKNLDCLLNKISFSEKFDTRELIQFLYSMHNSELKVRVITTITNENVDVCKRLMRNSELYHLDTIIGNFCIVDTKEYFSYVEYDEEGNSPFQEQSRRALYSRHLPFVRMQQYLFENLLAQATPAKDKIKEIERGITKDYINTIQNPVHALQMIKERIHSASQEILILFSTINSFYRAESEGILDLLGQASSQGIAVRALIKVDDQTMRESSKQKIKQKHDKISVNFTQQSLSSKITTIVIDQTFSFGIEVNDDSKKDFPEATGLTTFSNSESTVFTYYSMFENLWIQAELERQNSIRQAYFQMFKRQNLKDEIYKREWKLKEK
jgi:hypothetical protein